MSVLDPLLSLRCTYCQEDIDGLRIRCAECKNFDLCLNCFSSGAEIGTHKNDHNYQFMDSGSFSIFEGVGAWTAKEELRLIDAIEQYGYGNWEDISRHIETRSPSETKDQFCSMYVNGNIGQSTWGNIEEIPYNTKDHTTMDCMSNFSSKVMNNEDAASLGFMPRRDDFEREFDNDAESLVSQLIGGCADDEDLDIGERELKLRIRELMRYRKNGITHHTECLEFEAECLFRNSSCETRKHVNGSGAGSLVKFNVLLPAKE